MSTLGSKAASDLQRLKLFRESNLAYPLAAVALSFRCGHREEIEGAELAALVDISATAKLLRLRAAKRHPVPDVSVFAPVRSTAGPYDTATVEPATARRCVRTFARRLEVVRTIKAVISRSSASWAPELCDVGDAAQARSAIESVRIRGFDVGRNLRLRGAVFVRGRWDSDEGIWSTIFGSWVQRIDIDHV